MSELAERQLVGELLAPELTELIDAKQNHEARAALMDLLPPETADVLVALDSAHRPVAFRLLPRDTAAEVFTYLSIELQEQLLSELSTEQMAQLFNEMSPDDRALLFEELPGQLVSKMLGLMRPEERRRTQVILGYPERSIGRIMTPEYLTVHAEWTVAQAMEHIRKNGQNAESFQTLYAVDEAGRLIHHVTLRKLILAEPAERVDALMDATTISLRATDDREEAVAAMAKYDTPVLPVIDRDGVLVGIVTFDDVADVAKKEVTEDIQKMGGMEVLDEPYLEISMWSLFKKRGTWLSVLFFGEMLTASAMTFFQAEIDKATVLALFLPLIISSGGNSGSQASTLIIRAMALGEVRLKDWWRVMRREITTGLALGLLLGVIGLVRVHIWSVIGWADYSRHYDRVAFTIGASLIGVVLWGSLMGSMLPFILRRAGLDPAAISAPLVATLVDVTGLIIYFTTAMMILRGSLL
jgi:magnesium transporter